MLVGVLASVSGIIKQSARFDWARPCMTQAFIKDKLARHTRSIMPGRIQSYRHRSHPRERVCRPAPRCHHATPIAPVHRRSDGVSHALPSQPSHRRNTNDLMSQHTLGYFVLVVGWTQRTNRPHNVDWLNKRNIDERHVFLLIVLISFYNEPTNKHGIMCIPLL